MYAIVKPKRLTRNAWKTVAKMSANNSDPKKAAFEQSVCFFHTSKLKQTEHFYTELLGLPLALDQGACQIYQVSKDGFIGFCTHREPANPDGIIITLATQNVEEVYEQLLNNGILFEQPLSYNERFNITNAFIRDPNGYLVEIQRFEDPRWNQI